MWLSASKKMSLGFSATFLLLLLFNMLAYHNIQATIEMGREIGNREEVLLTLEELLSQAKSAKVGQGYLLTRNELFLSPYRAARKKLLPTLQYLQYLLTDTPQEQKRLSTLHSLLQQRLAFAESLIEAQPSQAPLEVTLEAAFERGEILMTEIHALIDELRSEQLARLQQQPAAVVQSAHWTLYAMTGSAVMAFVFMVFAGGAIRRAQTRRLLAERALLQARAKPGQQAKKRFDSFL